MPLEQTIDDSVSVEEQLPQDSSYAQTSFTESVKDSIKKDTLIQDSVITTIKSDTVQVDTTYLVDMHPQDISDKAGYVIENLGKWGSLRIYGSMRLNGAYDFEWPYKYKQFFYL
ncbi:MAG: hypothetical protein MZV64_06945 [Ignavibacteriales bacterium]|nr:hypothetical protein [Ignavibacteriales bacterium]